MMMANQKIKNTLNRSQGTAARVLDHMPRMLQKALVKTFSYPYDYPDLDPFIKCILAIQHQQGEKEFIGSDPVTSRKAFEEQMQFIRKHITKVKRVEDLRLPLQSGTLFARHYHPAPTQKLPMVVYYHGGGFVVGSVNTHDEVCRLLAVNAQVQVLSIDYPLAPEVGPQALIQSCEDALAWAYQNRKNFKILKSRIAVAGDSAGGNIATVLAQRCLGKIYAPQAQLLIYPVTDLKSQRPSYFAYKEGLILTGQDIKNATEHYAHAHQITLDDPLVSPIYGNLKKLAPTFIVTTQHDVLHDEGEIYAQTLKQNGVKISYRNYTDQTHGFINLTPISKNAKKYTVEIFKDFRKFWDRQDSFLKGFLFGRLFS